MPPEPRCVVEHPPPRRSAKPEVRYDVWAMTSRYRVAMRATTLFEDRRNPPFGSGQAPYLGRILATSPAAALKRYRQEEEKAANKLKVST